MRIGGSLLVIAIGAILKWAVTKPVNGVDLGTVGVILMIVGAIGLVISLIWMMTRRRTDIIQDTRVSGYGQPGPVPGGRSRTTYVEPRPYDEP